MIPILRGHELLRLAGEAGWLCQECATGDGCLTQTTGSVGGSEWLP